MSWVFELTEDVLGVGRKGDRVVVDDAADWSQTVVRRLPFNPGKLLLHLTDGQLIPLSPDGEAALVRLASSPPPSPTGPRGRQGLRRRFRASYSSNLGGWSMPGIDQLINRPWTVRGPKLIRDEHGNEHWEIRVDELPAFMLACESRDEALNEYLPALKAYLEAMTEDGKVPAEPDDPTWLRDVSIVRRLARPDPATRVLEPEAVTA
mgnify:FL=1